MSRINLRLCVALVHHADDDAIVDSVVGRVEGAPPLLFWEEEEAIDWCFNHNKTTNHKNLVHLVIVIRFFKCVCV